MKKILFLVFIISTICSCKQQLSKTSSYTDKGDCNTYLYTSATGKNSTPIVCRFTCKDTPTQTNKQELCSSPVYIERSTVQSSSFSNLLKYIDNNNNVFASLNRSQENSLNSLFDNDSEVYDTSIGHPDDVCNQELSSTSTSGAVTEAECTITTGSTGNHMEELMQTLQGKISSSPECLVSPIGSTPNRTFYVLTDKGNINTCWSIIDTFLDTHNFKQDGKTLKSTPTEMFLWKQNLPQFQCKANQIYSSIYVSIINIETNEILVTISTSNKCSYTESNANPGWDITPTDSSTERTRFYKLR